MSQGKFESSAGMGNKDYRLVTSKRNIDTNAQE